MLWTTPLGTPQVTREAIDAVNVTVANDELALIPAVPAVQRDTVIQQQGNYNIEVLLRVLQQAHLNFELYDWKKLQDGKIPPAPVMILGSGNHFNTLTVTDRKWVLHEKTYSRPIYNVWQQIRQTIGQRGILIGINPKERRSRRSV